MTYLDLDAIRQRTEAATPGPWMRMSDGCGCVVVEEWTIAKHGDNPRWTQTERDGDFIAHARDDVPALLAELDRLRAAVDRVRALHRRVDHPTYGVGCFVCGLPMATFSDPNPAPKWPCPTVTALTD